MMCSLLSASEVRGVGAALLLLLLLRRRGFARAMSIYCGVTRPFEEIMKGEVERQRDNYCS